MEVGVGACFYLYVYFWNVLVLFLIGDLVGLGKGKQKQLEFQSWCLQISIQFFIRMGSWGWLISEVYIGCVDCSFCGGVSYLIFQGLFFCEEGFFLFSLIVLVLLFCLDLQSGNKCLFIVCFIWKFQFFRDCQFLVVFKFLVFYQNLLGCFYFFVLVFVKKGN